ncbi:AAA family ATPase [Salipaludibacillus aurantiacus]|uniref:Uridine kinase n=1 Tax=Salipaludibacillus aurantiacus TaxID=1601833 RepID=A0A1H9Q8I1_9BACI|nr:AAA family ATPase [Salipaludibacillus aurantiacus]SER56209.1 Uridine kinase [Salipaludibacillus aurantiacus]
MKKEKRPVVVAIAGVSGGGKTTLAEYLREKLYKSDILYFDDYEFEGPEDIIDWVDSGADYDKWNLDPFFSNLKRLLNEPLDYIILDYPFAYKHSQMRPFIDYTVFIDTPLDVAMARRIMRDFKHSTMEELLADMGNYISRGRRGYVEMLNTIKPNSDIIVDGTLSVAEIADEIYGRVMAEHDKDQRKKNS